jgi:hypothetical protein
MQSLPGRSTWCANIRLGWKYVTKSNASAFYSYNFFVNLGVGKVQGHLIGYSVKHREVNFMMPGANPIKLFADTIYKFL